MFWGCVLKENQPYKVQHVLEDGEFSALHLSNAMLAPGAKGTRQHVMVSMKAAGDNVATRELKNLCIANLSESKDQQALDIYLNVSQDIIISTKGPNEVHLSGYFEPGMNTEEGGLGDMGGMQLEDDEEDDESVELSDDEVEAEKAIAMLKAGKKDKDVVGFEKNGDVDKSLKAAKKNALKNAKPEEKDDEDDSDESDEDFDQMMGEEGEDSDDFDLDDDSEDEAANEALAAKIAAKAKETQKKLVAKPEKKGKASPVQEEDSDDISSLEDDSDDEETDLQALLKGKKAPQQQKVSPPKVSSPKQVQEVKKNPEKVPSPEKSAEAPAGEGKKKRNRNRKKNKGKPAAQ